MKKYILPLLLLSIMSTITIAQVVDTNQSKKPVLVLNDQTKYFINSNSVRVRSLPPSDPKSKILGEVSLNDRVFLINPAMIYDNKYVEVNIALTYDQVQKSEHYFISIDALSSTIIDYKEFVGKYFIVVNVATETVRLYERVCPDNSCPNKMIMESEVVVGQDKDHPKEEPGKGRSILGSYRVVGWTKFYQDGEGHYPAWYRDGYPDVPAPDAFWSTWFQSSVMPKDDKGNSHGVMRGAFGWYTAFVEPEPYGQWLHGTLGWGSDHDKFIKKTKETFINIVSDPRSSGCTRNNNEAIAYFRNMIDIGTPIIKIYAKEEILDPTYKDYSVVSSEWKYVLTKNRNHAIDREEVKKSLNITDSDLDSFWAAKKGGGSLILDPKSPLNQILEVGTYQIDSHPDVIAYTPGEKMGGFKRKLGRNGNVYGIKSEDMHGVYYIDAGMLEDYKHPGSPLEVSGFMDEVTPIWMDINNIRK